MPKRGISVTLRDDNPAAAMKSVVGTIDIAASDPGLLPDEYLRLAVDSSLSSPFLVREEAQPYDRRPRNSKTRRRG